VKSAEVTRYTDTAYDGQAGSRMERARVRRIPVHRRWCERECCDLEDSDIRKRPKQADVTGRWFGTKKERTMERVDGTGCAL
jgi:hypothetical protein